MRNMPAGQSSGVEGIDVRHVVHMSEIWETKQLADAVFCCVVCVLHLYAVGMRAARRGGCSAQRLLSKTIYHPTYRCSHILACTHIHARQQQQVLPSHKGLLIHVAPTPTHPAESPQHAQLPQRSCSNTSLCVTYDSRSIGRQRQHAATSLPAMDSRAEHQQLVPRAQARVACHEGYHLRGIT